MKQKQLLAVQEFLSARGWVLVEQKPTVSTWQKCHDVCVLRISLSSTRQPEKKSNIEFGSHVYLKIWQKALPLVDNIRIPIFNVSGGFAKPDGFREDYSLNTTVHFSPGVEIENYLSEHLAHLEARYLDPKAMLQKCMTSDDLEKVIREVPPQMVANIGQLLLSQGRIEEGLRCLEEYAKKPFNKEIEGKLLAALNTYKL